MNGRHQIWMVWGISCLWVILPGVGYGADLTIGNNVSTTGTVSATSFTGNGSGLTNLDPAKLSQGTANINISGNASTVTNGLYNSGSYADPPWIISLSPGKLTSGTANINITGNAANATTAGTANSVAAGAVQNGGLANNSVNPQNIAFYSNVAIVAPILVSSGYNYFNNPATAMSNYATWCGTPSANNPCLLKIMPGVYNVSSPVVMQPYIDIEGSGENTTIIWGSIQDPVVKGASNAELRFLTVMSTGSGTYSVAIGNSNGSSPKLTNVTVTATGSPYNNCGISNSESSSTMTNVTVKTLGPTSSVHNYAVYNQGGSPTMTNVNTALLGTVGDIIHNDFSSPIMTNVTATADSGGIGIHNWQSSPTMANVTVTISGGSGDQYGIYNDSSSPIMTNVTITISGGGISDYNYGFYNHYSSPTMTNVTATVSGNSTSICHGVYNDTSSPTMTNVTAFALGGYANYGVYNYGGAPVIRDTLATATNGSATNAAIRNDNNSSVFLSNVTANASGGTYAFGLLNINTAGPVDVNHSTFSAHGGAGDTRGIRNDSTSTIKVGSSKISGTAASNLLCIYCYDGNYGALNSSCQ